jgi:hypothetical protein
MKFRLLPILLFTLPLAAQPTDVRVQASNTQAVLSYTAPDNFPCMLEVSPSATFTPLVHDVDPAFFAGSNSDSRPGNVTIGPDRQFVVGKRDIELANAGANSGRYFSRALESNTPHYYRLTCSGGQATGSFNTVPLPFGNTFGEPFQGDPANPGAAPYPYLDPSTRNSFYIDPQTGLRHVAVTAASDFYEPAYLNQAYSDATDMDGATWTNPANIFAINQVATSTTGTGSLWVGVRNTQASGTYDFGGRGPSYDDQIAFGANGSINYYQVVLDGKVDSGTDAVQVCLTVQRGVCATPATTLTLTSSFQTFTVGTFSAKPDGANGGNGADPVLFNANPPINRWQAFTHTGTVTATGGTALSWATGNYFNTAWDSTSFLRLSTVSTTDACANGTANLISSVISGQSLVVSSSVTAGTYFYCANNFGVLIKRVSPDSRTVSVRNAKFNLSYSPGPMWFSTANVTPLSYITLNNGFYMVVPPASSPMLLYFFNPVTGASTLIGPMKPNSNAAGADQWFSFQTPGNELTPFDNIATAQAGHLVWYNAGSDASGKQIIIKGELSGTPAYQSNAPSLMDETGATITHPDAYSVQVVNHGMTAKFTDLTPSSQGKDLTAQMNRIPSFNPTFMSVSYLGTQNGKIYLQGRGNQNTISVFARLDPATGLIDNFTDSWSRPNCRWCPNHSAGVGGSDVDYLQFGTDPSGALGNNADGGGPWIVTTNDAIAASPSVTCPANSIGAPTAGTACDIYTLNAHGVTNPYEPYDPDPGAHETDFLQAAMPGDWFCVSAASNCGFGNELVYLVAKNGNHWTMWRPGNLRSGSGNLAIAGAGVKNFFAWCTGLGDGTDSNGLLGGTNQGGPVWYSNTGGDTATWYRDVYFEGAHSDFKFNIAVNGTTVAGQFVEVCEESVFCGTPGTDRLTNGYRIRQGALPGILNTPPAYVMAVPAFAGATGNSGSGSHLSVGGLVSSFTDDRPFLSDGLNISWGNGTTAGTPLAGTTHVYKATPAIALSRKQLLTAAVAGPHVLKDVSSSAAGNQITDATDFSYCVALAANECRTGSAAGDVYVSASGRTFFGCYAGSSIIDVFAPGGNVQEDICVFPSSVNANAVQQFSMNPDPVGWLYGRVLTYLAGKNKMDDAFANVRVLPDSSWVIGNERWGTPFRNEVVAVKMPPIPPFLRDLPEVINRSNYIPLEVQIAGVPGSDGVLVDFGYGEYGSDGLVKFYCMSRQENCVANQASVNAATPFLWASETVTPMACANGGACKVTIPAVSGRALYYRIRRTLAGATVATEPTQVQVTR